MKTYLYRASNLSLPSLFWPLFRSGSQFLAPVKTVVSCNLFILIIIITIIFFRLVFLECTEAIATSLIPLVINFSEIFSFIIGFSVTVWTKMSPLLAHYGMLADAILIFPFPTIPLIN